MSHRSTRVSRLILNIYIKYIEWDRYIQELHNRSAASLIWQTASIFDDPYTKTEQQLSFYLSNREAFDKIPKWFRGL